MIPSQWSPPGHEIYLMANTKNKQEQKKKGSKAMVTQKQGVPNRVQFVTKTPNMKSTNNGLIVRNREFFRGNTTTPTLFRGGGVGVITAGGVALDQANYGSIYICPTAFPWLSNVANSYSNFKFRKFHISYVPTVATTTSGLIALATFPNADDGPNNTSVSGALAAAEIGTSIQGPVWDPDLSIKHDCSRYREPKPTTIYTNIGGSDPSGSGIFPRNYSTSGLVLWFYDPAGSGIVSPGRLYVDYEVELTDPVFFGTSS